MVICRYNSSSSMNCCNYYGMCPDSYYNSSDYNKNCWYYYPSNTISTSNSYTQPPDYPSIIGGSVAGFLLLIVLIGIIYACCRRQNEVAALPQPNSLTHNNPETNIQPSQQIQISYLQPSYGQPYVPSYGQPAYGESAYNKPVYGKNMQQNSAYHAVKQPQPGTNTLMTEN